MLAKIKKFLNHERYQTVAFFLAILLLLICYSCQSEVRSIQFPDRLITRTELELEVNNFLEQAEIRAEQLNMQDSLKSTLYEIFLTTAETGTFDPVRLIISLAAIIGIGATADNVRKRRDIKKWESGKLSPNYG